MLKHRFNFDDFTNLMFNIAFWLAVGALGIYLICFFHI